MGASSRRSLKSSFKHVLRQYSLAANAGCSAGGFQGAGQETWSNHPQQMSSLLGFCRVLHSEDWRGMSKDSLSSWRNSGVVGETQRRALDSQSSTRLQGRFPNARLDPGPSGELRKFCREGRLKEALHLLDIMSKQGVRVNNDVYDSLLQECIRRRSLAEGEQVRAHIVRRGWETEPFLGTNLVRLYASCGQMTEAQKVFDKLSNKNVVSWSALIQGYVNVGLGEQAFEVFQKMAAEGVKPDKILATIMVKACANLADLEKAKEIHAQIISSGLDLDTLLENSLIDMYVKCKSVYDAREIFDNMTAHPLVSWTVMIAGYAHNGIEKEASDLFKKMQEQGVLMNSQAYVQLLTACSTLNFGRQIHDDIKRGEFGNDSAVGAALVLMYAKCGSIESARQVFDSLNQPHVVVLNAMLAGYVTAGQGKAAVGLYAEFTKSGGKADRVTFVHSLNACASIRALDVGQQLHTKIMNAECEGDVLVVNSLIDMYAKCGDIHTARMVFDRMKERTVVSWTSIITGYARCGLGKEALLLYQEMLKEKFEPTFKTFPSVLSACASAAALEQGKQVHALIKERRLLPDIFIENSLVDMYAKCGSIEDARQVFDKISSKDCVSWTAMLVAYTQHGLGDQALDLLKQMFQENVELDRGALAAALTAYAQLGLVKEGQKLYDSMVRDYGISPDEEHHACMVDLLGRAREFQAAENFILNLPSRPGFRVWMALLKVCCYHRVIELAEIAADKLFAMDKENPVPYVMLGNTYGYLNRWDDEARVRKLMVMNGTRKETAVCSIEFNQQVHEFTAGNEFHPQSQEFYSSVNNLRGQLKQAGYDAPVAGVVLHDVEEQERERPLHHHADKLALASGLINTPPGTPIRIAKNLRVGGDCHNALKSLSRMVKREILVRDPSCHHRFKNGVCTCGDLW